MNRAPAARRLLLAAFLPAVLAAATVSLDRAEAPAGGLRVSMKPAGTVFYPRQDMTVTLMVSGDGGNETILEAAAFAREAFTVEDAEGHPPRKVAEAGRTGSPPDAANGPAALAVRGFDKVERTVNLSAWYPGLTSRTGWWTVSWAHGGMRAGPIRVHVVKAYRPGRDRLAVVETTLGRLTWELMPEAAPEHVKHFVDLARSGFYDGLTFFRVIPGLEVQGGDPKGDGTGAWDNVMMPEISARVKADKGLVGASRQETSMTSDCMFFITLGPSEFMQGKQTFFARLADGLDVVARMYRLPTRGGTGMADAYLLNEPVTIQRITIE